MFQPWSLVSTMMVLSANGLWSTASTTCPMHSSTAAMLARYACRNALMPSSRFGYDSFSRRKYLQALDLRI